MKYKITGFKIYSNCHELVSIEFEEVEIQCIEDRKRIYDLGVNKLCDSLNVDKTYFEVDGLQLWRFVRTYWKLIKTDFDQNKRLKNKND